MRSGKGSELEAVAARFAGWRAGRRGGRIPSELWAAAARLVEHHGSAAVCDCLSLNAERFEEVRETLGIGPASLRQAGPAPVGRTPRRIRSQPAKSADRNAGAFLELPALRMAPVGRAMVPDHGDAAGNCTLVIDGASGTRLTITLREPDPEMVHAVCQLVSGVLSRSDRCGR